LSRNGWIPGIYWVSGLEPRHQRVAGEEEEEDEEPDRVMEGEAIRQQVAKGPGDEGEVEKAHHMIGPSITATATTIEVEAEGVIEEERTVMAEAEEPGETLLEIHAKVTKRPMPTRNSTLSLWTLN